MRRLNLPPEWVTKTPSGDTFVKTNLQKVNLSIDALMHLYTVCEFLVMC